MADANVRISEEARDRLAAVASAEGISLRAYLTQLANQVTTPAERAERARAVLRDWSGYAPTPEQAGAANDELNRRLAALRQPPPR